MRKIESIIFCSPKPTSIEAIKNCLEEENNEKFSQKNISHNIKNLKEKFDNDNYSFEIIKIGGGYQFLTKSKYSKITEILLKQQSSKTLNPY